jgi:hypothetical protein
LSARERAAADGIDALRSVYETFTEGFDTPDLVEARTVLDEVEASSDVTVNSIEAYTNHFTAEAWPEFRRGSADPARAF